MKLIGLFPKPVATFDLSRKISSDESNYIEKLETRPNMGNITSVDTYVLSNKPLHSLKKFIINCLDEYMVAVYSPISKLRLKITQSWINYTVAGQYHHKHQHSNSLISGVFYVKTDNTTDRIYFYKDTYDQLRILPKEYNIFNSESWWLEAIQGTLILFPSNLTHMVHCTDVTSETRISLSFNTFPIGQIGQNKELTELFL